MGVYIKGMEMPTSCWDCEVGGAKQMDNAVCPFYSMEFLEQENYQDKIADGCPLVPVPPHGRLIDADKLKADNPIHRQWQWRTIHENRNHLQQLGADVPYVTGVTVGEIIDAAPTVIPAEEGEHERILCGS